jgi:hypothetical protein
MHSRSRLAIAAAACAAAVLATTTASGHPVHDGSGKEAGFDRVAEEVSPGGVPQERLSDLKCKGKSAGIFPCHRVDLASFVPLSELGGSIWANDVWGWTDPRTGRDYALAKLFEGTAFVDITDETDPVYLGTLLPGAEPGRRRPHLGRHQDLPQPCLHRLRGAGPRHPDLRPDPAPRRQRGAGVDPGRAHRRARAVPQRRPQRGQRHPLRHRRLERGHRAGLHRRRRRPDHVRRVRPGRPGAGRLLRG